jgi:predicted nucleic acid-binding protein
MAGRKPGKLKVLVDSDVIFDFISARLPYYYDSQRLFILAEKDKIQTVTLPHLLINVWQIRGHMKISNQAMYKSMSHLLNILNVLDEPAKVISNALMIKSSDFEDWVTVESAIFHKIDAIVTRNTKHFKKSPIEIYTPQELLKNIIA